MLAGVVIVVSSKYKAVSVNLDALFGAFVSPVAIFIFLSMIFFIKFFRQIPWLINHVNFINNYENKIISELRDLILIVLSFLAGVTVFSLLYDPNNQEGSYGVLSSFLFVGLYVAIFNGLISGWFEKFAQEKMKIQPIWLKAILFVCSLVVLIVNITSSNFSN
ncbi:hypothetical protein ACFPVS_01365 [Neisseria weixii]|uniref:Uncharacterized protein n=1 Tax=Neisseria weixii TaxID=1853276 RepID=A0A3N4N4K0_9NEIS|nr:hypothetical protein [Neisseria weixii]ATD64565.1 hypothetical protein CGZ65_03180 [Neisseria weixii]RPD90148.1 hypothetical protein EGK74_02295 [Neisseria weixii]RPD90279.1 hypothetical protein EGK75_02225 [Neisseria weixii]